MSKLFLDDKLWTVIASLLLSLKRQRWRFHGHMPLNDCQVVTDIGLVRKAGIPWKTFPSGEWEWFWNDLLVTASRLIVTGKSLPYPGNVDLLAVRTVILFGAQRPR
jgi:hypothetical protein